MRGATDGSEVWNRALSLNPGESLLVKARSGQGKTTLLSILYGLRHDYRGRVCLDDSDIRAFGPDQWHRLRRDRVSFVFQDLQLFDELTAWQNVELKNRLTGHKPAAEIEGWFEALGLADKRHTPAGELSRGQKQRTAIIRALCQPFQWLLLDEPFSHLDRETAQRAAGLIQDEAGKQAAAWILASLDDEPLLPCPARRAL